MNKTAKSILVIAVVVIILGGLYLWSSKQGTYVSPQEQAQTSTQTGSQTASLPVLNVGTDNATLGNYLIAANGMTLYYFTKDTTPGASNCTGACAISWPAYTVSSTDSLTAGTGIAGTISTITRDNGSIQLTYNNAPLYFWSKDVKPGDTTGQNIGGVWFVVKP